MWILKKLSDGTTKYLISEKKSYTVGRKNCDFVLEDDASVSRKHCTIHIAKQNECPFTVNTVTGVWVVDERSKYGTYLMDKNDWIKINPNENKKLTSGSIIKFGLMGNIWSLEFKPILACASGIPTEQKKAIDSTLQSINGFLRNSWCKECSLVVVKEITLTVKVVLALINGVPIVTPNYIQKLVESVKNQVSPPSYENYTPVIKESILDKSLVLLDSKVHRKELFKGIKFIIPTKTQLETLKEVITSAGGSCELLSSGGKFERYAEDNIVVIQLPINNTGISEDLCKLFKSVSTFLKNNYGIRVIPESEIAQAVAYSSTEKFCNPRSTCFALKIGEKKQLDLGPIIVEETPIAGEDITTHFQQGVIPSSETMQAESTVNPVVCSQTPTKETTKLQMFWSNPEKPFQRKRPHSPNHMDNELQKKKPRSTTGSNVGRQPGKENPTVNSDTLQPNNEAEEKSNPDKPTTITSYYQKQVKPPGEKVPTLVRQASSSFWDFDVSNSKPPKRKVSNDTDDSLDISSTKRPKRPEMSSSKENTPEIGVDTPREIVEVSHENKNSRDSVPSIPPVPRVRKIIDEEDEDRTSYFGKDAEDTTDLQVNELNNTIFSLTIISPAFIKEDGTLIDPPSVPVNVKRFKKQKIFTSAIFQSLAEQNDELSDGEWIEPHSNRVNISVVDGFD